MLKKIIEKILKPHIAVLVLLTPTMAFATAYALKQLKSDSPISIAIYVFAFYTLTLWCVRFPRLIEFFKKFKKENKYASRWFGDVSLRMKTTLTANLIFNCGYAIFQFILGIQSKSLWFGSLALYYLSLAIMRFLLAHYTLTHKPRENLKKEASRYRICGWLLLLTSSALSIMIFNIINENRETAQNQITAIALAAYTFTILTIAIVNVVKYRKFKSPVFSASKAVSLATACVSMLTLEKTMLTTFDSAEMTAQSQKILLTASGTAVSLFIIGMAIYMIKKSENNNE